MLKEKILSKSSGIITYAITPPKQNNTPEKITEISQKHIERIKNLNIDGLVIYDIQDESDRQKDERPFPFFETVEPVFYNKMYLQDLNIPKIIYRYVGKYTESELSQWLNSDTQEDKFSVFVGSASRNQKVNLSLSDAYILNKSQNTNLILGGVVIPERHTKHADEHIRITNKSINGCNFFISQVIYNIEASKNFLSDYYYHCIKNNIEMLPILFTLAPCGSLKTLEFMKWLGINIPKWLENDLIHSEDILYKSLSLSKNIFEELFDFAFEKGIPIGCNIESVSIRKVEIDASVQLVQDIKKIIERKQNSK